MKNRWMAPVVLAIASMLPAPAGAQGLDTSIDVQNYRPAPGPGNYLGVMGSDVSPHLQIGFNLDFNFQYEPLVLERADGVESTAVGYQATLDFDWALGLFNIMQIGVALPVVIAQDGKALSGIDPDLPKLSTTAIRDLRIYLKGRLLGGGKGGTEKDGPGLAISLGLSVPTGNDEAFAGDSTVTVDPVVVFDYRKGIFKLALNVGARIRQMSQVADFQLGHQLLYGLGLGVLLVDKRLQLLAEYEGMLGLNGKTDWDRRVPMEARLAIGWAFGKSKDLHVLVGAGMGFTASPTAPQFRVLGMLRYSPVNKDLDSDGVVDRDDLCIDEAEDIDSFDDADGCPDPDNDDDGVLDGDDKCPGEEEDADGFEDEDGCPEADNDGDGLEDAEDTCPVEAEDPDSFDDEDGCPDEDNDADGAADAEDACPNEPEDDDGFDDGDGCPEYDNDADGKLDAQDPCPVAAEDVDGFEDEDGCPETDNDRDGVADGADKCPLEPETLNGKDDEDGCPDKGATLVVVTKDKIEIKQQVNFEKDSDKIVGDSSFKLLDMVAAVLLANPDIKVEVQGHTDDTGDHDHNMDLSQRRAESVVQYLIGKGVAADDLTAKGYGPDVPIADNKSKKGKAQNRRVEFHILPAE